MRLDLVHRVCEIVSEALAGPQGGLLLQRLNYPIGDHFPFAFDVYLA